MKKRKELYLAAFVALPDCCVGAGTDRVAAIREKLFNPDSKDVLVVSHRETGEMPVKILLRQ